MLRRQHQLQLEVGVHGDRDQGTEAEEQLQRRPELKATTSVFQGRNSGGMDWCAWWDKLGVESELE